MLDIPDLLEIVRRWDGIFRPYHPPEAPWYASVDHCWGEQQLSQQKPGKNRSRALEKHLRLLFSLAEVPYISPYKFRHGQAVYGLLHAKTMADDKAVSMNLMHDSIRDNDSTFIPMLSYDVQACITASSPDGELETYLASLGKEDMSRALVSITERLAG